MSTLRPKGEAPMGVRRLSEVPGMGQAHRGVVPDTCLGVGAARGAEIGRCMPASMCCMPGMFMASLTGMAPVPCT